jgi:hypothetical protein
MIAELQLNNQNLLKKFVALPSFSFYQLWFFLPLELEVISKMHSETPG